MAAGGIFLREGRRTRVAIVRLRRDKSWVLPKGKLNPGERPVVAAKREVMEETGHDVSVHAFLGSMSYPVDGKIKIVQFWHMHAIGGPVHELIYEIRAVKWLSLKQAIDTLTRAHERVFLANVGPIALKAARQLERDKEIERARQAERTRPPSARSTTAAGIGPRQPSICWPPASAVNFKFPARDTHLKSLHVSGTAARSHGAILVARPERLGADEGVPVRDHLQVDFGPPPPCQPRMPPTAKAD